MYFPCVSNVGRQYDQTVSSVLEVYYSLLLMSDLGLHAFLLGLLLVEPSETLDFQLLLLESAGPLEVEEESGHHVERDHGRDFESLELRSGQVYADHRHPKSVLAHSKLDVEIVLPTPMADEVDLEVVSEIGTDPVVHSETGLIPG